MSLREVLRGLPMLDRDLPAFPVDDVPDDPLSLFGQWLREAVAAGVAEPHAVTLSTMGVDGLPDARIVTLRDVDASGFEFVGDSGSAKGHQLATHTGAALSCYWREQGRQIRVRGPVVAADPETCARDFLRRPILSRAAGLSGRQSTTLEDQQELARELDTAYRRLQADPHLVAAHHTVYTLHPMMMEFWQGDSRRRHVRLCYRRTADDWFHELLWP